MKVILLDYWPLAFAILITQICYAIYRVRRPGLPPRYDFFLILSILLAIAGYSFMALLTSFNINSPILFLPVALGMCFIIYKLIMRCEPVKRLRLSLSAFLLLSVWLGSNIYWAYNLIYVPRYCGISSNYNTEIRLQKLFGTKSAGCIGSMGTQKF